MGLPILSKGFLEGDQSRNGQSHAQGQPDRHRRHVSRAGQTAPAFTLVGKDLGDVSLKDFAGKRKVLDIVVSLDTGICATSARKFNETAGALPNTVVLVISGDLPFAAGRFCTAEGLTNVVTLSTFRGKQFLRDYGVEITSGKLVGLAAALGGGAGRERQGDPLRARPRDRPGAELRRGARGPEVERPTPLSPAAHGEARERPRGARSRSRRPDRRLRGSPACCTSLTGGVDLGVVSVRRFSKPFLVLLALAAVRAALPRPSWLTRRIQDAASRARATLAALEARSAWAPAALDALTAVLSVHVLTKGTAFLANLLFGPARPRPFPMPFESARFAETFAAWDSGWYFDIAQRGYYWSDSGQSSLAFFPLYPLLMRALAWPFGGGDRALWISGIALAYLCLLLGLTVLHRLTEEHFGGREVARRTVLYVAVFPFAYFFTQVYTESLFLLTSVSAVAAAFGARWGWAGVFGALAALTRPNGILIAVPLGLLALAGRPRPAELARRTAALALVPLGFAAFCAFAYRLSGDPLGWLRAQAQWGYSVGNRPWVELMRLIDGLERNGLYGYFFSDPLARLLLPARRGGARLRRAAPSVFRRLGLAARRVRRREPLRAAERQRARGHRPLRGDAVPGVHAARECRPLAARARGAARERRAAAVAAERPLRHLAAHLLGGAAPHPLIPRSRARVPSLAAVMGYGSRRSSVAAGRLVAAQAAREHARVDPLRLQRERRPGARGLVRSAAVEDRQPAQPADLGGARLDLERVDVAAPRECAPAS